MARLPLEIGEWGTINRVEGSKPPTANCWFRDARGDRVRVQRTGKSPADAERRLKAALKLMSDAALGTGSITAESTVAEVAKVYFDELEDNDQKSGTITNYRSRYKNYIEPTIGSLKLRQVTVGRLSQVVGAAKDSPHTAKNVRVVLMNIFEVAVRHDAVKVNIAANTRAVKVPKGKVIALRPDKVQAMLRLFEIYDDVHGTDMYDPLLLLASTGARAGELLAFEYSEFSYNSETDRVVARITGTLVAHHETGKLFKQETPKSLASERGLTLPKTTSARMLRRWRGSGTKMVFPSQNDRFQWPNNFRTRWNRITSGTEFEGVTPKAFRKAVATHLDRAVGKKAAQEQLGHESEDITSKYYIEMEETVADFSEHLEALVTPTPGQ